MKHFYVYLLANKKEGFLYTGITSALINRTWQHKTGEVEGHTKKYNIKRLVYFETYDDFDNAVKREKQLKKWRRAWKVALIEKENPSWNDLYEEICQ